MTDREPRITPLHGAGGELMDELLARLILPRFGKGGAAQSDAAGAAQSDAAGAARIGLSALDDGATVPLPKTGELVITTDNHVVKPVFFPGGDIGRLAAAGTLNDLAVMGARPIVLTLAAVIEEGFPIADLERILDSFAAALAETDAVVACGDTKVMPAGELDGIVLNTTGLGVAEHAVSDAELTPGDVVIVSGTIGDHGMALLAAREEFRLSTELRSDVAVLWPMIARALAVGGIHAMKDPTRGGLAAALNEMARKSSTCIEIQEAAIPIRPEVAGLSDLLGISPLEVANEGKAILVVDPARSDAVLAALRAHPLGANAAVIGRVTDEHRKRVILSTEVGGRRFLDMPLGDPVPRIC